MQPILHKLAHRILAGAHAPPSASPDRLHVHLTALRVLGMHDAAHALLDGAEGRAIARTNLVLDEVRREVVYERGWGAVLEEGARAREAVRDERERNWLEFLAILDATIPPEDAAPASDGDDSTVAISWKSGMADRIAETRTLFTELAETDGTRDRAPLLGLLELERRARAQGAGQAFGAWLFLPASFPAD